MLKNNYHTHMKYCNHATGDVEDYVSYAINLGFKEIGMSDHAPIPQSHGMTAKEWKENYCDENMTMETFNKYLTDIEESRLKHPEIKIYKALETEYLENSISFYKNLANKLDYMILGIHFFRHDDKIYDVYSDMNHRTIYYYYENFENAVKTGLFKYIAHPDIFMYDYKDVNGEWNYDANCKTVTNKIIDLAVKYGLYLEINANGLKYAKRSRRIDYETFTYPNLYFWTTVKEYQQKNPGKLHLIVGADAHKVEALDNENVEIVYDFIKDLGLEVEDTFKL